MNPTQKLTMELISGTSAVPATLQDIIEIAHTYAVNEKAASTRKAYRADLKIFTAWCQAHGLDALPASPDGVATFLAAQAQQGIKPSTLTRRVAAIKYAHELAGHDSPTHAKQVAITLRGIRRSVGTAPTQKAPATAERIADMVAHCPDNLQGWRDRALLLLGFSGAFRRSELVALSVEDIQDEPEGLRVKIRRSKTDQEGLGTEVAIYRGGRLRAVEAMRAWLEGADIRTGPVFRPLTKGGRIRPQALSTKSVATIVKIYAAKAGLDPAEFAGHSLRAGFLTSAAEHGASIFKMMEVSRHKSVEMLRVYVRRAELFKDHAGRSFL